MPNYTMDRLEGAVAGQLQCFVRWLVAWRAFLPGLACCTSNLILSGGKSNVAQITDGSITDGRVDSVRGRVRHVAVDVTGCGAA
jgi:hypothetical protein